MWIGVIAGVALVAAVLVSNLPSTGLDSLMFSPMLFGPPVALGFFIAKRLRWFGAIYLAALIATAYYAAFWTGFYVYDKLGPAECFLCNTQPPPPPLMQKLWADAISGACGGAVGSLLNFAGLALLARDLRDKRARKIALWSVLALTVVGAAGMCAAEIDALSNTSLVLFVPWQLAFGAALIALLGPRQAR